MRKVVFALLLAVAVPLASTLNAVPVACDCATCLLSPDRLCTEPETVKVWRCDDYTAARCPIGPV